MLQQAATIAQIVSTVLTLVALIFAALTVGAARRQRLRQFESLYVARYWSLMDRLSLEALRGVKQRRVPENDQLAVRSYIRLCEDECELRKDGWIGDATWAPWAEGMKTQFKRWPCNAVWQQVSAQEPDLYEPLRDLLERGLDVPAPPRRKRATAGLMGGPGV